jgi:hypoxanthine-DNA glycosylase
MNGIVCSFPPVCDNRARVLILGSMPGAESLARQQYYAHPRNAFWSIMQALAGAGPELEYAQRLAALRNSGIALWDVLSACRRAGSLDANIEPASELPNDIAGLLAEFPRIALVCFNGATAERLFNKHVRPQLATAEDRIEFRRLPSTSPAHAAMRPADKLAAWRKVISPCVEAPR